jgi:hypothetical protein
MFSLAEFQIALARTKVDHPQISPELSEIVMRKYVQRWEVNREKSTYERTNFGELIRFTLNELNVGGKATRQMYSALIGHYYTRHASYVNKKHAAIRKTVVKKTAQLPYETLSEKNGQLGWKI